MNIGIVAPSPVPLAIGGAERLWWGLLDHINRHTEHNADLIKIPGPERSFWEIVDSYRRFSRLDLSEFDVVISGKYPAWMVEHHRHVVYMLHPLRGLYDTYPALPLEYESSHAEIRSLQDFMRDNVGARAALGECFERLDRIRRDPGVPADAYAFPGPLIRALVHFLDSVGMASGAIARFCALSRTVASRPGYFPEGREVHVAHPPPHIGELRTGSFRHLLTASRLDPPKRIDLLVSAVRQMKTRARLLVAGTGPAEQQLRELAGGDERISFLGYVPDERLVDLYADALAVLFVPYQEDYGYIAVEGMLSGKPVVTATDSGGPTELIEDGVNGVVAHPDPGDLALRLDRLLSRPRELKRMGRRGLERARQITWERVLDVLLAEGA